MHINFLSVSQAGRGGLRTRYELCARVRLALLKPALTLVYSVQNMALEGLQIYGDTSIKPIRCVLSADDLSG